MSRKPKAVLLLSNTEKQDILMWFGWGSILGYPTGPRDYLREAMSPANKPLLLAMERPKRKAILRFVIAEHARRTANAQHSAP